jgi:hypothetical protein
MDDSFSLDPNMKEYQIQKLYIKKLEETDKFESLENDLKDYFSSFGTVIDVKTLRNCNFISKERTLCLRYFPRGGVGNRSPEYSSRFQKQKRWVNRFHSAGLRTRQKTKNQRSLLKTQGKYSLEESQTRLV